MIWVAVKNHCIYFGRRLCSPTLVSFKKKKVSISVNITQNWNGSKLEERIFCLIYTGYHVSKLNLERRRKKKQTNKNKKRKNSVKRKEIELKENCKEFGYQDLKGKKRRKKIHEEGGVKKGGSKCLMLTSFDERWGGGKGSYELSKGHGKRTRSMMEQDYESKVGYTGAALSGEKNKTG